MRLKVLALAAVASLVLATGAVAAATDPQLQTTDADTAWADAMTLQTADFGSGWKYLAADSADAVATGPAPLLCANAVADQSDLVLNGAGGTVHQRSDGAAAVLSSTWVWQSEADAQASFDRNTQPAVFDCFVKEVLKAGSGAVKLRYVSRTALPFGTVGTRTAAYRFNFVLKLSTKVKVGGKTKTKSYSVPFSSELVLFGQGRANVLLLMTSFGRSALRLAYEQSLAAAVAARMQEPSLR